MVLQNCIPFLLLLLRLCATEAEIDCKQNPETGNCFIDMGSSEKNAPEAEKICRAKNASFPIVMYPSDTRLIKNTISYSDYRIGLRRTSLKCTEGNTRFGVI